MLSPLSKPVPVNAVTSLSAKLFADQPLAPGVITTFSFASSDALTGIEIVQAPLIDFNSPFKSKDPQPKKPNGPVLVL